MFKAWIRRLIHANQFCYRPIFIFLPQDKRVHAESSYIDTDFRKPAICAQKTKMKQVPPLINEKDIVKKSPILFHFIQQNDSQ